MALEVRVYRGDDSGGPVDYATPIATYPGTLGSFPVADLAPGRSRQYAIRTFDPATGLQERNTDARVTIARDAAGRDVSDRPAGPSGLSATATRGGGVLVAWSYLGSPVRPDPDHFQIYISEGTTPDYAATPTLVPWAPRTVHFAARLSGLVDGVTYAVAVRSLLSAADDGNTAFVTFEAAGLGPRSVEGLAGVAVYKEGS